MHAIFRPETINLIEKWYNMTYAHTISFIIFYGKIQDSSQPDNLPRHIFRLCHSSVQGKEECKGNKILVRGVPENIE